MRCSSKTDQTKSAATGSTNIDGDMITLWTKKSKNANFTSRWAPKLNCLENFKGKGRVFTKWDAYLRFLEYKDRELDLKKWNWHNLRRRRASIRATECMTGFEIDE